MKRLAVVPGTFMPFMADDFWTKNVEPMNAGLPRKGAGDRRAACPRCVDDVNEVLLALKDIIGFVDDHRRVFAINYAKGGRPGELRAAEWLRHQQRENAKQRGLAGIRIGRRDAEDRAVRGDRVVDPAHRRKEC